MKTHGGWKLFHNDNDAVKLGTPFRVWYFISNYEERFLYFVTREEAFRFVQNHHEIDRPEIKDIRPGGFTFYPPEL